MRRTLFPEPGSSGKSVLYFVLSRHLLPLAMPRVTGVKLPSSVYFGFRRADEQKFQFLPFVIFPLFWTYVLNRGIVARSVRFPL